MTGRDEGRAAFAAAVEPYRRELRVHCYRLTGSFEESEDLLQETLLRAWRGWTGFQGKASVRTWLYRIATNVCLAFLEGRARRVLPWDVTGPADGQTGPRPPTDRPWLEPFPNELLASGAGAGEGDPSEWVERKETIELAFLAALQVLPGRQRAALVLRDVLGLPAAESAHILSVSVPALKSALQRARAALRQALPAHRASWPAPASTTPQERAVLRRYVAAVQERDGRAMATLLREDLRVAYPPRELWVAGRDAFIEGSEKLAPAGDFHYVEMGVNRQPAIAVYLRPPGSPEFRRLSLAVLRVEAAQIVEIIDFSDPRVLDAFGLPERLPQQHLPEELPERLPQR